MATRLQVCKFLLSGTILVALLTLVFFNATNLGWPFLGPPSRTVLYWTKIWERDEDSVFRGEGVYRCSPTCIITTDRSLQAVADSIVFHHADVSLDDIPGKAENQEWIFMIKESAVYTNAPSSKFIQLLDSDIDAFMSFRSDSLFPAPDGTIVKKRDRTIRQPFPLKPEMAAWFVSHCHAHSGRTEFVTELSKYISVDVYGACGPLTCPRGEKLCDQLLEETYSFYLALENSLCKDYVTDMLYRTMAINIIPVVFGPKDNYSNLPKKSFIHADDFDSIRSLAEHLKQVASNESLYNSYLDWKTEYEVRLTINDALCAPCTEVKDVEYTRPKSWSSWWFDDAHCDSGWKL